MCYKCYNVSHTLINYVYINIKIDIRYYTCIYFIYDCRQKYTSEHILQQTHFEFKFIHVYIKQKAVEEL